MKASKFLLNLSAVICFIYGTLYIFSLVFIPIGIYCFISAKRFVFKAEHLYDTYSITNKTLKNYVIFASIACFPLGLISIIPYLLCVSNNVKVSALEKEQESPENSIKINDIIEKEEKEEREIEEVVPHTEESEAEKIEKFNKLKSFHEKGIITDDELEMAREQLFGKKEDNL